MQLLEQIDSSTYYYNQALSTAFIQRKENEKSRLKVRSNIATLLFNRGDYESAREEYQAYLDFVEEERDTNAMIIALVNIGATYIEQGLLSEAIDPLVSAYALDENLEQPTGYIGVIASNICAVFSDNQNCESGIPYCEKAVAEFKDKNEVYYSTACNNLATCLVQLADYTKAIEMAREGLKSSSAALKNFRLLLI
ncbi:MAG: tetratricopeptide repeat protein, partial [Bacteroidota bacterium]